MTRPAEHHAVIGDHARTRDQLDRLGRRPDQLAAVRALAPGFTTLVCHRTPNTVAAQKLDAWISQAAVAGLPQLASFANGLNKDVQARQRQAPLPGLAHELLRRVQLRARRWSLLRG